MVPPGSVNKFPGGASTYAPYNMESLINQFTNKYIFTAYLKSGGLKRRTITWGRGSRKGSRKTATWNTATRTTATRTTATGQLLPGQLPHRTIAIQDNRHPDNCHLGQLLPRTTATQDDCHPDNCHLGQLPPRTSATPDNYHPDNCHLGQLPPDNRHLEWSPSGKLPPKAYWFFCVYCH